LDKEACTQVDIEGDEDDLLLLAKSIRIVNDDFTITGKHLAHS
jgi:hypothetical protein